VGQQALEGRAAIYRATGEQRRIEPATVLIRAFQIQIRRLGQFRAPLEHADMSCAGIEPDIEGIGNFPVVRSLAAEQFGRLQRKPGFDAFPLNALCHLLQQFVGARMQFGGFLVHKEGDGRAPVALA
jgi:hypothetical protein